MVLVEACVDFPPPFVGGDAANPIDAANTVSCLDDDGDGYLPIGCESALPHDCNDTLQGRNPGALEICGNAIDENCDDADLACADELVGNEIDDMGGYSLVNGSVAMQFDESLGMMISRIERIGTSLNLLHTTGSMPEKYIGIGLWEEAFQWRASTATTTVLARGPAVFRLRVESSDGAQFPAKSGIQHELETDSVFTVFPDGRIHRDESATVAETTGDHLSAFLALDPALFARTRSSYDGDPVNDGLIPGGVQFARIHHRPYTAGPQWACAHTEGKVGPSHMIGMLHDVPDENSPDGPRVSYSNLPPRVDTETLSIVFDWRERTAVEPGTYTGDFLIWTGEPEDTGSPCQEMNRMSDWIYGKRGLLRFTDPEDDPFPGDSNTEAFDTGGGFWRVQSKNPLFVQAHLETDSAQSPAARPAFRISGLALRPGVLPYIQLDGAPLVHGRDYLWQAETDVETSSPVGWLFLQRELGASQPLTIRVPPELQQ